MEIHLDGHRIGARMDIAATTVDVEETRMVRRVRPGPGWAGPTQRCPGEPLRIVMPRDEVMEKPQTGRALNIYFFKYINIKYFRKRGAKLMSRPPKAEHERRRLE